VKANAQLVSVTSSSSVSEADSARCHPPTQTGLQEDQMNGSGMKIFNSKHTCASVFQPNIDSSSMTYVEGTTAQK
jgi:hypothetical protein